MYSLEQIQAMFSQILSITSLNRPPAEQQTARVAHLLTTVKNHCHTKNITIPKAILEANNTQGINNYIRNQAERSHAKIQHIRHKMQMFQLAHSVFAESFLNDQGEQGEGKKSGDRAVI